MRVATVKKAMRISKRLSLFCMNFSASKPGVFVFGSLAVLIAAAAAGCQGRSGAGAHPSRSARVPEISAGAPAGAGMADTNGFFDLRVAHADLPDYEMRIESAPAGAQVVIDGRPIAKTPCRVLMNGTQTGFFLDALSVKVRFIATDEGGQSETVEELFSKHDKIPARLRFSPEGAKRTLR